MPFPEAGAPAIITFGLSDFANATTRLELEEASAKGGAERHRDAGREDSHGKGSREWKKSGADP